MTIITTAYGDARLTREFWAKTRLDPKTLCWIWTSRHSQTGTPMHGAKVAWRFAHERLIGPLVRGSVGRRACENPSCVNPAHRVTEKPRNCPTCGHVLEQNTRSEIYQMADGKVAVSVKDVSEETEPVVHQDLAPTRLSMSEVLNADVSNDNEPDPSDDPNNVEYGPDDAKLTMKYKDRGRYLTYGVEGGRYVREDRLTEAQASHLYRELDGDGYFRNPKKWTLVE